MPHHIMTAPQDGPVHLTLTVESGSVHIICEDRARAVIELSAPDGSASAALVRDAQMESEGRRLSVRVGNPGAASGGITNLVQARGVQQVIQVDGDITLNGGSLDELFRSAPSGATSSSPQAVQVTVRVPHGSEVNGRVGRGNVVRSGPLSGTFHTP